MYENPTTLTLRSKLEGKGERFLVNVPAEERDILRGALLRRRPVPLVRTYLGKSKAAG